MQMRQLGLSDSRANNNSAICFGQFIEVQARKDSVDGLKCSVLLGNSLNPTSNEYSFEVTGGDSQVIAPGISESSKRTEDEHACHDADKLQYPLTANQKHLCNLETQSFGNSSYYEAKQETGNLKNSKECASQSSCQKKATVVKRNLLRRVMKSLQLKDKCRRLLKCNNLQRKLMKRATLRRMKAQKRVMRNRKAKKGIKDIKQKKGSDEEMEDLEETPTRKKALVEKEKMSKTPTTLGVTTLFMGNISYSVDEDNMYQFFESTRDLVGVHLTKNDNDSLKGYGHAEFATEAVAMMAMKKKWRRALWVTC